ncbi:MAG: hypothetical protein IJ587_00630 [Synergistaceae bacterium]|nr:hypothetical protein [Synergistaceae bacterium]
MPCLECKNASPDALSFRVLEVHTLHIRDFNGERIIQALGEFRDYEICTACASKEARAFLYPAERLLAKCFPFMLVMTAGIILSLTLTLKEVITALRAVGPIAVFAGASGIFSKAREILSERERIRTLNPDEALRYSAYKLVIKNAPKKYGDNDITYIPVNKEVMSLSVEELSERYNLLRSIARKAFELIKKESEINE